MAHRVSLVRSVMSYHIYYMLLFQLSKHFVMHFSGDEVKRVITLKIIISILVAFTYLLFFFVSLIAV